MNMNHHQDKPLKSAKDPSRSSPTSPAAISTPNKAPVLQNKNQLFGIRPASAVKNGNGPFGASRSATFRAPPSEKSSLSTPSSASPNGQDAEKNTAITDNNNNRTSKFKNTTVRVVKIAPRPPSQPIFRAVLPRPTYPTFANTQQNNNGASMAHTPSTNPLEPMKPPPAGTVAAKRTDPRLAPKKTQQLPVVSLISAAQRAAKASGNGHTIKTVITSGRPNGATVIPTPTPSSASASNPPKQQFIAGVLEHRGSFARPISAQQQQKVVEPAPAAPAAPPSRFARPIQAPAGAGGSSSAVARQSSSTAITPPIPITGVGLDKNALVLLDDVARSLRALWHHPPHQQQENTLMLHRLRALFAIDPSVSRSRIARECSVRKQSISLYLRGMFRGKQDTLEKKISVLISNYFSPLQVNQRRLRRQEEWAKIVPATTSTTLAPASTSNTAITNAGTAASAKRGSGIIAAISNAAMARPHLVPLAPKGKDPLEKKIAHSTGSATNASKASNAPNATVAPVVAPPRPLSRKSVLMQADIDYHTRKRTLYANDGPPVAMRQATRRIAEDEDEVMTEEESTTNEDKKEEENHKDNNTRQQQQNQTALRRSARRPHPPQECLPPSKRARAE